MGQFVVFGVGHVITGLGLGLGLTLDGLGLGLVNKLGAQTVYEWRVLRTRGLDDDAL